MIPLITEIIEKYGPRPAGSEAERNAQLLIVEKCKQVTDNFRLLEFEAYLNARFGKLKYYSGVYIVCLGLYFFSPVAAFFLSLVNAVAFVLDFMTYHTVLGKFPGPKMKSWNAEAVLEPQGEVKSTLVFSGHIDSVYEFKWWYKLGQNGMHLTIIAGVLLALFPVFCLLTALLPQGNWSLYTMLAFVVLSPALVAYYDMHGHHPVDGACDNLSGVAIAHEVFKSFASPAAKGKSVLKNTRLRFVSFGSEETGLTGSQKYVEQKAGELRNENAHLINIDSIRVPEEVCIVKREIMSGTAYSPLLIEKLRQSFNSKNIPVKTGSTPVGGTDGVFFGRAGLPAVSIVGLSMKTLDPTYHTRRDVVDNLSALALENVKNGLIEFAARWDSASNT